MGTFSVNGYGYVAWVLFAKYQKLLLKYTLSKKCRHSLKISDKDKMLHIIESFPDWKDENQKERFKQHFIGESKEVPQTTAFDTPENGEYFKDTHIFELLTKNITLIHDFQGKVEYLLHEFGTSQHCNRFDVGNSIESLIIDILKKNGATVKHLQHEKRYDLQITINNKNSRKLSIKFTSSGDIKLHNSNNSVNKDMKMKDTIIITLDKLILISDETLTEHNISLTNFLVNKGDGLSLKRTALKELQKKNYPHIYDLKINYDKTTCKNRNCYELFLTQFLMEYSTKNVSPP